MALLSNDSKTNVAFKKLVGKAHTGNPVDFFAESIPSQISINLQEVIGDDINENPQTAVDNGIAEFVNAQLDPITSSQVSGSNPNFDRDGFLAFNLEFPDGSGSLDLPGGGTVSSYSGTFGTGASGDPIRNFTQVISQKNNLSDGPVASPPNAGNGGYIYDLRGPNGSSISLGSEEGWQVDPVSGTLVSQQPIPELQTQDPAGYVRVFLYTGRFLDETLSDISSGSGFSGTTNDIPEPGSATRTSGDNIYFTNERVDDRLNEVFIGGTNVTTTYDDANDEFTVDVDDEDIQDAIYNNVLSGDQTRISVTYDDANAQVDYVVDDDLSNYDFSNTSVLEGLDINDSGTGVISAAETLNFGTSLSVTDDGNNQVTINAASALAVDNSGTSVNSSVEKLNFGARINASQDGTNTEQVNVAVEQNLSNYTNDQDWISGVDVDDSGTDVNTGITTLNFGTKISVTDDGGGQVTIDGSGLTSVEFESELESILSGGTGVTITDTSTGGVTTINAHQQNTDTGTSSQTFGLNTGAATSAQVLLKSLEDTDDNQGELQVRDSSDSAFRDLRVRNLEVDGTETINNTTTISTSDNEIVLNDNLTDSDPEFSGESGIRVNRGDEIDAVFEWNESANYWQAGTDPDDTQAAGTVYEIITTNSNVSNLTVDITTDDVSEGTSNFYFTAADAKDAVFGTFNGNNGVLKDSGNDQTLITVSYDATNKEVSYVVNDDLSQYDNSTSLFISENDTDLSPFTTDDLSEGSTNEYFTDSRAQSAIVSALTTNTTSAIDISSSGGGSTIAVDHGNTGGATDETDSDTYVNNITFDSFGHVESVGAESIGSLDELQKLLPSAPNLSNSSGTVGESANLSFDSSNSISGVTTVPGSSRNGTFNATGTIDADGNFGNTFGVVGTNDSGNPITISGDLNSQVDSTDQHNADVFSNAATGTLELVINEGSPSEVVTTINLESANTSLNSSTPNGSVLNVGPAEPLEFPNNNETFDGVRQRTGSWTVAQEDLRAGYNEIVLRHNDGQGGTFGTSQTIQYVLDDNTATISFSSAGLQNESFGSTKELSGVAYHTSFSVEYSVAISNVYRNTYSNASGAIRFPSGIQQNVSVPSEPIPPLGTGDGVAKTINVPGDLSASAVTASVNETRLIGESVTVQAEVVDPVDTESPQTTANAQASGFDLLLDNAGGGNQDLVHDYNDESHRFPSDADVSTDISTSAWDSSKTLVDGGDAGYNDGLQTIEGQIEYPRNQDFSTTTIADAPSGNPDYSSGVTGERFYYGIYVGPNSTSGFGLDISGSGTLVPVGDTFTQPSDELKIEVRNPASDNPRWYDITQDFDGSENPPGAFFESNGDVSSGAVSGGYDISQNETIGIQIPDATASINKLYYRITVPQGWTGNVSNTSLDWGATEA
jgi:hypothetical protein